MARKNPPPAKIPAAKPQRSAIYRLNPLQRKFVLALKRTNFNQTDAYMQVYGQTNPDLASSSACNLMKDLDIQEAVHDMVKEADTFEVETLEKIAGRFVKLAEESGRESDRIRANELLAKIHPERYLDDRANNVVVIADGGEISLIRERMRAAGKLIDTPAKTSIISPNDLTVESEPPKSTNNNDVSSTQPVDSIDDK